MTIAFHKGRYGVRVAADAADLHACQTLRHRCFFGTDGVDADRFDPLCTHVMIAGDTGLVGTFRVMHVPDAAALPRTYAAKAYDLEPLARFDQPMLEMGRFCIDPAAKDGDVLRLAWGALTQLVDAHGIGLLFGCSSFAGTDPAPYAAAFGLLASQYCGPATLRPARLAPEVVPLVADRQQGAAAQLPPLLRTYLAMGGWVSDHAVIDRQMATLHVFTGLEIAKVPPQRAHALRALLDPANSHI
ncbi:ornithine-acyl[acyl carrier protein] N-acyltransferase [Cognatiyoonia koreensis]|uniref:L-ornithine N(alpha)-acyltransferase n=1 Tax=Cognatiyoonia koreensis TaxID=364200 RepID=A0A1I0NXL6_9RHOB|nr:GNAT family N-acyltransferase [Cognatiyoonia koreensis]SEW06502.1 ornithine-acyl[acyl carrier protein] N-acyltransferase [Cognatiyoonia koreensis]